MTADEDAAVRKPGERATRGAVGESDTAISYVWQTPVRCPKKQPLEPAPRKSGPGVLSPGDRGRLARIVARAPEVMVKVTGRTKGADHLVAHLAYITRDGQLSAETEEGVVLTWREGLHDLQTRWTDDVNLDRGRRSNATLSVNLMLSMPPGTDPTKVRDAVRAFALEAFEQRHDFAFVQHEDEAHPHVHLTVRSLGYDGRRLNPRKADLHHWRERFAEELRLRGVAAEATPRRARGRFRKADRGVLRAMRDRGTLPRMDQLAREAVVREARGEGASDRPWEAHIAERQSEIRARYRDAALDLARSSEPADRTLAAQITTFLAEMPAPSLRRHELRKQLADHVQRSLADRDIDTQRAEPGDRLPERSEPKR